VEGRKEGSKRRGIRKQSSRLRQQNVLPTDLKFSSDLSEREREKKKREKERERESINERNNDIL